MSPLVVGDRVEPEPDEPWRDQVPDVRGRREPVDQQDVVPATRPLADVEADAIVRDGLRAVSAARDEPTVA